MGDPMQPDFEGTAGVSVGRRLGAGAFGVVYEAFDRRRNVRVALKTLPCFDAGALYRFKREFRAIADISHRNLVRLYDLVADGERCFFTMELVEGPNLVDYVRGGMAAKGADGSVARSAPPPLNGAIEMREAAVAYGAPPAGSTPLDMGRLRDAFAELAEAVSVLHAAGMLHRDLKPSNVLVGADGRVVLLDFGLVAQLAAEDLAQSTAIVGTPQYMAPEQMSGEPASEASDWYGVGVMLYEALTGQCPFHGPFFEMLARKRLPPPEPCESVPGVPAELSALCQGLLHPDPSSRPSGREVYRQLRSTRVEVPQPVPTPAPTRPSTFVDRRRELQALEEAFLASKRGRPVTVYVRGRSGIGKTALVRRFLTDLRRREPETVVLTGRCYAQEAVPYKALDSLVDNLSRFLRHLPATEAARLMPRNVLHLARLFPVLREVEAVAEARERPTELPSAQELRRRAAAALRELLARVADRSPLVLGIDDLQWGDVDSGVLLNQLVGPPEPPALMLLGCYRSEDAERSPLLRMLLQAREAWSSAGDLIELEVAELDPPEARELAVTLLAEHGADAMACADTIARDSAGHPYFLGELVQHVATRRDAEPGENTLEEVIRARVAELPEEARRLLEVVAVAAQPLEMNAAHRAAGLQAEEDPAVGLLQARRLIRTRATEEKREIVTFHDRIRETVSASLPAEAVQLLHERLAWALEGVASTDPETLATHFRAAGHLERAALYAVRAAEQAAEALAFDRAARLYQLALELRPAERTEERALRVKLGDALANAGRGAAAASAYLTAAEGAGAAERLDLQRRAAEQLLVSGHIDEGLAILRSVLGTIGLRLAATPRRALLAFLARRLQLRMRGLGFHERHPAELDHAQLLRIDTGWSVTIGLGMVDALRGRHLQLRHLLLALRAGEPYRIARALAVEVGYSALRGRRRRRRAEELAALTQRLAERVGHPHAVALAVQQAAMAANLFGDFRRAHDLCERAETLLREHCTGVAWELATCHIFRLHSLYWMGQWRELSHHFTTLLKEAQDRGDLYLATYLRARVAYTLRLAADDPSKAEEEQLCSIEGWSHRAFHIQHYWDWFARGEIALYAARFPAAWNHVRSGWPDLVRARLHYYEAIFIEAMHLRARAALALAAERNEYEARSLVRQAERDARRIEGEKAHWGCPLAWLIQASVAAGRGQAETARALAAAAEQRFESADMALHAAAARRRRGELLGGDEGSALVEQADRWMATQGIKNPARITAMLAPGQWRST